eukprot:EG_transcript_17526
MADPDLMEEPLTVEHDLQSPTLAPEPEPEPELEPAGSPELDDDLLLEPAVSSAPTLAGDPVPGAVPRPRAAVPGPPPREFDLSADVEGVSEDAAGGWKAMVSRARDAAVAAVRKAERAVRAGVYHQAEETFRARFPLMVAERVLAMYPCRARHGALVPSVEGTLTLTDQTLCFAGLGNLGLALPLRDIAALQPAVMLATQLGHPPYFLPTPGGDVLPDSVQVYTRRGIRYTFHTFAALVPQIDPRTPLQRAISYLDHAWRAATPVPAPGVEYVEGEELPAGCESDTV